MSSNLGRVTILDSTLSAGEQPPGVYFDFHIKLAIANLLNEIGIDIIYESIDSRLFDRELSFALDHMSGLSSVKYALSLIGHHDRSDIDVNKILSWVKTVGQHGRVIDLLELEHIVDLVKHAG